MTDNGNGNGLDQHIPPDIDWDADNPPTIFGCSQHIEHLPGCDQECGSDVLTESGVKLVNEARAWARMGMSFVGVPQVLVGGPFNGIPVEIFDTYTRVKVIQDMLIEKEICTREELDELFREVKFNHLQEIRSEVEPSLKEARMKQMLGLGKPRIIRPDGSDFR